MTEKTHLNTTRLDDLKREAMDKKVIAGGGVSFSTKWNNDNNFCNALHKDLMAEFTSLKANGHSTDSIKEMNDFFYYMAAHAVDLMYDVYDPTQTAFEDWIDA